MAISVENQFFHPRVFCTPTEWVPLGIGYWCWRSKKLVWWCYGPRKKFDDIFSHVDTTHQRVRQVDTSWLQSLRLCIALRSQKPAKCVCAGVVRWRAVFFSAENMSRKVLWRVTVRQKLSSHVISHLPPCLTQQLWRMYVTCFNLQYTGAWQFVWLTCQLCLELWHIYVWNLWNM